MKTSFLLVIIFLLVGCSFGSETEVGTQNTVKEKKEKSMSDFEFDFELSKGSFKYEKTDFARTLLASSELENENRAVSPLSYELVLMLLALTAEGDSLKQIEEAVGYNKEADGVKQLAKLVEGFKTYVKGRDTSSEVQVSFGIGSSSNLELNTEMVAPVKDELNALWSEYDFATQSLQAAKEINAWVYE
ncbi:MAG: hypothetical protein HRT45_06705 [Bdellovibrionales bacterium]|nr:hypothetical protein [Bdellovibrionales bacterium]